MPADPAPTHPPVPLDLAEIERSLLITRPTILALTAALRLAREALDAVDRKAISIRNADSAWTCRGLAAEQRRVIIHAFARLDAAVSFSPTGGAENG